MQAFIDVIMLSRYGSNQMLCGKKQHGGTVLAYAFLLRICKYCCKQHCIEFIHPENHSKFVCIDIYEFMVDLYSYT